MKKEEIELNADSIYIRRCSFFKRWSIIDLNEDNNQLKTRCLSAISIILNKVNKPLEFKIDFANNDNWLDDYCCELSMVLGIENTSNNFEKFELKDLYRYISKLNLNKEENYNIFLWYLEITLNYDFDSYFDKNLLVNKVAEALKLSNANVRILKNDKKYELYPIHEEFFDESLIIDNLIWLDRYKVTKEHFSKALKMQRKKQNYRNIIDELRFSLESFFQQLFSNKKTLENQKENIGSFLKTHNVSSIIANMYIKLLDLYTNYNNDNAKHGNNIIGYEVDYLIYLTGSFIRFILLIENSENEVKE